MKNEDKHQNCICYESGVTPLVEIKGLSCGDVSEYHVSGHEVIFIIEGELRVTVKGVDLEKHLHAGEFIFIPAGITLKYQVLQSGSVLFSRMADSPKECNLYRIQKTMNADKERSKQAGYSLRINDQLAHFMQSLIMSAKHGLKCKHYLNAKGAEFIYLLHASYSVEECANFFSSISGPDVKFSETIRRESVKHRTVHELADALNISPQVFARRFYRVFGEQPSTWINKERRQRIYLDICQGDKPIEAISIEYFFANPSNLTRYCKREYGATPQQIRDRH